ncbi:MAG TPA: hypothetical protein VGP58_01650 [Pyrinomonadaceae bacterium]|nr:hypothetical protein [Pyrinomonadaceae bacterium]
MKKFIISVLCVSVFFIGLGGIIQQVGASFKSDERALGLIRQARIAIGGDANINNVRSLSAKGKAVHTFNFNGTGRTQEGDFELNLALPNQFSKMMKLRIEDRSENGTKQIISEDKQFFVFKKDKDNVVLDSGGNNIEKEAVVTNNDGDKTIKREVRVLKDKGEMHNNDLLRTMLSLFLTAPEGVDVAYFYIGAGAVDGNACEIVEARTGSNSVAKLYLSKLNNLPLMMSYQGMQMPKVINFNKDDSNVVSSDKKDVRVIVRKAEASEMAEINVKFSDYRSVGGLQLPHRWTQSANGEPGETVNIESYEINPANIAERFGKMPQKVMIRTEKSQ